MLDLVSRDIILSIKPKYADQIMAGAKTIELRRRFSSAVLIGARAFIYSSTPAKALIGYATIADVRRLSVHQIWRLYADESGVSHAEFTAYFKGLTHGYAISLREPRRFRIPPDMQNLRERFGFRAPQSYRYAGIEYSALIT
jgi:predicted transcriptional regulator